VWQVMQVKYTGEDVVVAFGRGGGGGGGGVGSGMERIVGLLKWIGEMGCPPFYNHAILYISRRLIASHAILLRVYNVILIFVKTIISKYNIIIIITIRNRYTSSA